MPTRQIPREEWNAFFRMFSEQHEGWLSSVELLSPEAGHMVEAKELPLQGISLETKGTGAPEIVVVAGTTPERHLSHAIRNPIEVWTREEDGVVQTVEIRSPDQTTLLQLKMARQPGLTEAHP